MLSNTHTPTTTHIHTSTYTHIHPQTHSHTYMWTINKSNAYTYIMTCNLTCNLILLCTLRNRDLIKKLLVQDRTKRLGNMKVSISSACALPYTRIIIIIIEL